MSERTVPSFASRVLSTALGVALAPFLLVPVAFVIWVVFLAFGLTVGHLMEPFQPPDP